MLSDTSDCESPSLLEKFKRFEYRHYSMHKKQAKGVTYTDNDQSQDDLGSPSREDVSEPSASSNGHINDGRLEEYSQQESPLMPLKSRTVKRRISSDSENEDQNSRTMKRGRPPEFLPTDVADEELYNDKERGIRIMMTTFPKADITVLTEVLKKFRWNADKAVRMYRGEVVSDEDSESSSNVADTKETIENELLYQINSRFCSKIDVVEPASYTYKDILANISLKTVPVSKVRGKTHELSDDEDSVVSENKLFQAQGKQQELSNDKLSVGSENKLFPSHGKPSKISDDEESLIVNKNKLFQTQVKPHRISDDEESVASENKLFPSHSKLPKISDDEESLVSENKLFQSRGKLHAISDDEESVSESKPFQPRCQLPKISDDEESVCESLPFQARRKLPKISDEEEEESVASEEKVCVTRGKLHELSDDEEKSTVSDESVPQRPHARRIHKLSDDDDDCVVSEGWLHKATHVVSDDDNAVESAVPQTSNKAVNRRNKAIVKKSNHKKRKKDDVSDSDCEDYARDDNSSDSDDSFIDDTMTPARAAVFDILQEGTLAELASIPGCSRKKAETIIQCRPFKGWADLVRKFDNTKHLAGTLLSKVKDVIFARDVMKKLMKRCERISLDLEAMMSELLEEDSSQEHYIEKQPAILNKKMKMSPYQLIGLNWLYIMHKQQLNGILADEMGLGKTIQAIAFLAYLRMNREKGRHLIVVPSSTLDNWLHEFELWCPDIIVLCYHGPQDDRKEIRLQILNEEIDWDVMVTTYNMVSSSYDDRGFFRKLKFHYVIFDEAHMLKNMGSQRYQNLMRVMAKRRLLLTGTPLQNNLVELMSLLIFVMPGMFYDKIDQVKQMFSTVSKSEDERGKYERERIRHAKRIMKPFVLRRLKSEVLQQLPTKHEETVFCAMSPSHQEMYDNLVQELTTKVKTTELKHSGIGMMMELRKAANHPLLVRKLYTDEVLRNISKLMLQEPTHCDANPHLIFEDMQVMSDFEINGLCKMYKSVSSFQLDEEKILDSGKFKQLDKVLPKLKENDARVLLFSQFTMMLDIIEVYMKLRNHNYLRLDGQTPVPERQDLIDKFNENGDIFIFLLSTKAGGLGINLTAANVVFIHDIDFNPYNDKQAEDRCHRVGQTREVHVTRIISKNTIEEGMLQVAQEKLRLEKDVTTEDDNEEEEIKCVTTLLKQALGM